MASLFNEIKIKSLKIKNRIMMAPMCMYSADDKGMANDWHYVHYATRAVGGTGLIIQEATAVESCGRITDKDLGIWSDEHIEGLRKITGLIKKNGSIPGIQLAHAGRKSTVYSEPIIAPSPIAFSDEDKVPEEMTIEDIKRVVNSFKEAAVRAEKAGYEVLEIHGAHGYLIHEFLSPLSNKRKDMYGGSLENRVRFLKEIIIAIREVWSSEKPLMLRVSAEDYVEGGNHDIDLANMINIVKNYGLDMINVSSGAIVPAHIHVYPGYQIGFAETIKRETSLVIVAGGLITDPRLAEYVVASGKADMVFLGRELLRNPYWPLQAARELRAEMQWPDQYERGK